MDISDKELVLATLSGDREAFGQLVERHERGVCAVIVQIVHDTHAAQDVAQETFLKAYRDLGRLHRPSAFGSWLYQIARRSAISWLRKQASVRTAALPGPDSKSPNNGRLDEISEQLLDAVMKLPRQEQRVVLLRYFEGHSVRVIGTILDRPVGTVTQQLSRARARLRQRLEARYHDE